MMAGARLPNETHPRCNVASSAHVLWSVTIIALLNMLVAPPVSAWSQVELRSYVAVMGAVHRGKWTVAATRVREGLKSAPDSALLNNLAGAVFFYRGETGDAESAWLRVLAGAPDDSLAAYGLGLASLARGNLAEAETWAERAMENGNVAACLLMRAYASHLRGALRDPSVPLPDSLAQARLSLAAAIALRQGDHRRALDSAREALLIRDTGRYAESSGLLMTFDPRAPLHCSQEPMSDALVRPTDAPSADPEVLWRVLGLKPSRAALARMGINAAGAMGDTSGERSLRWLADAIEPPDRPDPSVYGSPDRAAVPLWTGSPGRRVVALTFDDGPRRGPTERILHILRQHDARATFFVVGRHAAANPDLVAQMAHSGMEIANHSFTHPNLTRLNHRAVQAELIRTSACIAHITGRVPRFFRPPGGRVNDRVLAVAGSAGLRACMWTVNAEYSEHIGPQSVVQHVLSQVRPGAVVLLHNGSSATLTALPEILAALKRRGYEFVTVSELAATGT